MFRLVGYLYESDIIDFTLNNNIFHFTLQHIAMYKSYKGTILNKLQNKVHKLVFVPLRRKQRRPQIVQRLTTIFLMFKLIRLKNRSLPYLQVKIST